MEVKEIIEMMFLQNPYWIKNLDKIICYMNKYEILENIGEG